MGSPPGTHDRLDLLCSSAGVSIGVGTVVGVCVWCAAGFGRRV